jgi:hypothetical protein
MDFVANGTFRRFWQSLVWTLTEEKPTSARATKTVKMTLSGLLQAQIIALQEQQ